MTQLVSTELFTRLNTDWFNSCVRNVYVRNVAWQAKGKKEQGKHDEKDAAENYEKHAEEIKEKDVKENKETGNNTVKGSNTVKGKNNVKGSNLMQRPAAARAREASAPALPTPPASLMEEALLAQLARE
jgi:hypothetical protein